MISSFYNRTHQEGVAALFIVVLVGSVSLLLALNASFLGLGEVEMGFVASKGKEALAVADGCMEETLERIRLNPQYGVGAGTINLSLQNGSCTIVVTGTDPNRTLVVTGSVQQFNKKIEATLTLSGTVITITNWRERTD